MREKANRAAEKEKERLLIKQAALQAAKEKQNAKKEAEKARLIAIKQEKTSRRSSVTKSTQIIATATINENKINNNHQRSPSMSELQSQSNNSIVNANFSVASMTASPVASISSSPLQSLMASPLTSPRHRASIAADDPNFALIQIQPLNLQQSQPLRISNEKKIQSSAIARSPNDTNVNNELQSTGNSSDIHASQKPLNNPVQTRSIIAESTDQQIDTPQKLEIKSASMQKIPPESKEEISLDSITQEKKFDNYFQLNAKIDAPKQQSQQASEIAMKQSDLHFNDQFIIPVKSQESIDPIQIDSNKSMKSKELTKKSNRETNQKLFVEERKEFIQPSKIPISNFTDQHQQKQKQQKHIHEATTITIPSSQLNVNPQLPVTQTSMPSPSESKSSTPINSSPPPIPARPKRPATVNKWLQRAQQTQQNFSIVDQQQNNENLQESNIKQEQKQNDNQTISLSNPTNINVTNIDDNNSATSSQSSSWTTQIAVNSNDSLNNSVTANYHKKVAELAQRAERRRSQPITENNKSDRDDTDTMSVASQSSTVKSGISLTSQSSRNSNTNSLSSSIRSSRRSTLPTFSSSTSSMSSPLQIRSNRQQLINSINFTLLSSRSFLSTRLSVLHTLQHHPNNHFLLILTRAHTAAFTFKSVYSVDIEEQRAVKIWPQSSTNNNNNEVDELIPSDCVSMMKYDNATKNFIIIEGSQKFSLRTDAAIIKTRKTNIIK